VESLGTVAIALSANMTNEPTDPTGVVLGISAFNGSLPTGTYTENGSANYEVLGAYNPGSPTMNYRAGGHVPTARPLKIVLTSISDSEVAGTFEGAFYKQDALDPQDSDEYVDITEGEFRLPRY